MLVRKLIAVLNDSAGGDALHVVGVERQMALQPQERRYDEQDADEAEREQRQRVDRSSAARPRGRSRTGGRSTFSTGRKNRSPGALPPRYTLYM